MEDEEENEFLDAIAAPALQCPIGFITIRFSQSGVDIDSDMMPAEQQSELRQKIQDRVYPE